MKPRSYDFSRHVRKGPTVTKQEIVESLQSFAKEKSIETFTHKQYDSWSKRVLCSSQISVRFGGWPKAMEKAGFSPRWNPTKNPIDMVENFMDCWELHDDCPTEKVLIEYLKKIDSKYYVNIYKRYFGGLRRLAKRVSDFHAKKISQKQLVEKYEPAKARRGPIPQSLRYEVLKRDGYKCQCCGRTPKEDGVKLEVDHILAVALGGTDDPTNLRSLCEDCNKGKSSRNE